MEQECIRFTCNICGHSETVRSVAPATIEPTETFFRLHQACKQLAVTGKEWFSAEPVKC
jgi:hypothetical protein